MAPRNTEKWREQIEKGSWIPGALDVLKTYIPESVTASEKDGVRKAAFVVSTGNEDRDGDTVSPNGWMLDNYRKNPVVLWAHSLKDLPVARAESIGLAEGKLKSVTIFPEKGIYPFADQVYGLVKGGFLRGTSVGFHPIEAAPRKGKVKGVDFTRQELYEFSILPIPSNREALIEAKSAGHDVGLVVKWAYDFLDYAESEGIWVPKFQIEKALRLVTNLQVSVPALPSTVKAEGHASAGAEAPEFDLAAIVKDVETPIVKYIKEENGKFCVYSESGKKLGEHATRAEAVNQLQAIEASKHARGKAADMDVVKDVADMLFGDQSKGVPPWMKEQPAKDQPKADAEPDPNDPGEASEVAAGEAPEAKPADKGEVPGGPAASGQPGAGQDVLFQGLQTEVEPLKQGGDPVAIATALKAALEKFATAFMAQYAVNPAQASPAAPGAVPPPPAAAAPAAPAPVPPPPQKKGFEGVSFDLSALSEDDIRETITKVTKNALAEARTALTGKLK